MAALLGMGDWRRRKEALNLVIRLKATTTYHQQIVSHRYTKQPMCGDRSNSICSHYYTTMATNTRGEVLNGLSFRRTSEGFVSNSKNPSPPPSSFACKKCSLKLAKEPVITTCGHVFCWPCLYQYISLGIGLLRGECPACQSAVDLFAPTRMVTSINVHNSNNKLHHHGARRRPSWVPPRPTGKTKSVYDNLTFYSLPDMNNIRMLVESEPTKESVIYAKRDLDSASFKLRTKLSHIEVSFSRLLARLKEMYLSNEYSESSKLGNTTEDADRLSALQQAMALHDEFQLFSSNLVDGFYSISKEFAVTAMDTENDMNFRTSKLFKELSHIRSLKFTFSPLQTTPSIDNIIFESPVSLKTGGFQSKRPRNCNSVIISKPSTVGYLTTAQQKQKLLAISGFHTSVTNNNSSQIVRSIFDIPDSKNRMEKMVAEINERINTLPKIISENEHYIDKLLSCMEDSSSSILHNFDKCCQEMHLLVLGLLDGWQWKNWKPREEKLLLIDEIVRRLSDRCKDWTNVVDREFTNGLGPIYVDVYPHYLPDHPSTRKVSFSTPALHTTFYCNVCGKVNDTIEAPVVTYCGHLFCWHCLCENAIDSSIGGECFHGLCPVCGHTLDFGLNKPHTATIVSVCGNTVPLDDFCTSSEKPPRPVPQRVLVPDLNESIRIFFTTAKEITQSWRDIHLEAQKQKKNVHAIRKDMKPALERFHEEISRKLKDYSKYDKNSYLDVVETC